MHRVPGSLGFYRAMLTLWGMALDPIRLEVFQNLLAAVCEESGGLLSRTAISPNIRERRDYSCALFDADARLVAQAAHIPVHLGSAAESV